MTLGCGDTARRSNTFVERDRFCVPESMTVELAPDRQAPVSEPIGACGNYIQTEAMAHNPISCGPCGFVFDAAVTRQARRRRPDACCYSVSSPPPPPPITSAAEPAGDPRWACSRHGDCVASCLHGAVSRAFWEAAYPGGEACEDGCSSKGTDPPMCVDGRCVARRAGADDPACTRLEVPVLEGPGPAHRCTEDEDCTNDCALGAVNRAWFASSGDGATCRGGCTAVGTEPARCESGTCVAYRSGERNDLCTRRSIWLRERPGADHGDAAERPTSWPRHRP